MAEEEIQRIVLDLHDGPVQDIFAALSQLTSLRARMSTVEPTALERLAPDPEPTRSRDACAGGDEGRLAIANAKRACQRFKSIFAHPRFRALAAKEARVQRPLWASTSTKNPKYSDVLYVETLIGPDSTPFLSRPSTPSVTTGARGGRLASAGDRRNHPC